MTDSRAGGRLDRIVFWGLVALIAWVPLPLGSNSPWSWSLLSLLAGVLVTVWALGALLDPRAVRLSWHRLVVPSLLFGLVVLWGMVQASGLTPDDLHDPLWDAVGRVLGPQPTGAISVDPAVTVSGAMRLLAYGAVFVMAAQFGRNRDAGRLLFWCIVVICFAYAVYGLTVYSSGNRTILGYEKWAFHRDLTATFVSRSAYGIYAGVGLMVALGLLADAIGRMRLPDDQRPSVTTLIDSVPPSVYVLASAAAVLGTTMLLSHSRGALAFTGLGIVVMFGALLARSGKRRGQIAIAAGAVLLAGLVLLEVSGGTTLGRIVTGAEQDTGRAPIHATAWRAVDAAPFTGHGLDTFRQIVYRYRTEALVQGWNRIDKAHSVYLELLAELGYVAFGFLMAALGWVVCTIATGLFRRRRDFLFPAVALGTVATIGGHNTLDFSVQMPAIAVTWSAILGVAYAQSWSTEDGFGRRVTRSQRGGRARN